MVDWNVAVKTARKLVKPGPEISMEGALSAVAELRDAAERAETYVQQVTGLTVPSATAPVLVVDRPGWIQANADAFKTIMEPLNVRASQRLAATRGGAQLQQVSSRVSGAEVGALLSYLAPKILGQFDPFYPGEPGEAGGRLLLVAPNVVMVERELKLDPADFRLWVCLHEETHRVQFTAVPWLREYLNDQVEQIVGTTDLEPGVVLEMIKNAVGKVGEAIRGNQEISIVDLVQTPAQRETVERITAVMSLLEGHADVVMDSVGPSVVPSVDTIRARFNVRRQAQGIDRLVRKLLGLDAKMRQYRDGAKFCNQVIDAVGMDGFNRVWIGPQTLPTPAEIADPSLWVKRVHGTSPKGS
ncbi:zinc-dependent metalloprotease [Microlunatus elymi]|uniref:Zinc-dependent metalloprotease n=2 Tax=Microlunatus elymi TaxID=2596828 RepID=A0A516Q539_9ACTN|nr:zinc-dependent metalloprotease [Microlunatus elymi]